MAAFFDSRGVLCHISEWRCFLIAGVFSALYPSGGVAIKKHRHSDIWQRTPLLSKNTATRIYSREHPCYQKTPPLGYRAENTPPLGYRAENTPAIKKHRHSDIEQRTPLLSKNTATRIYGREHPCYQKLHNLLMGWAMQRGQQKCRFLDLECRSFSKITSQALFALKLLVSLISLPVVRG